MVKIQTNPSKFIQRFIDIMSVNHEVKVICSLRVKEYGRCHVSICVDQYYYDFIMYNGKNCLKVNRWLINRMLQYENYFLGWSSFLDPKSMKQVMEIEIIGYLGTKVLMFDRSYKYQELKTWKQKK